MKNLFFNLMLTIKALVFSIFMVFMCSVVGQSETLKVNSSEVSNTLETCDGDCEPGVPEYYLPEKLKFISWDYPSIAHTGIDIDYKLTGYDWFNRDLKWSLEDAPRGMSIEKDGTLHWTPDSEGKYNVDVKLTLSDSEVITKNFTITVDNSRALFISPTGNNDTGDGSIDNPYLAFGEKVAKHIYSLGGHVTVYMRGGVHENQKFYSYSWDNPKLRRFTQYLELTKDTPFMIRNYPQEKAVIKMPVGKSGWKSSKNYRIVYGLEFSGGGSTEGGLLVLAGQSVAKRVQAHGFNSDAKGNTTGVKVTGPVILDQVVAWDNYDRNRPEYKNSSNFVFYGEKSKIKGDAYFIDCLSLSFSVVGFKIKHAGDMVRLHIHKSASLGSITPWGGVEDKSTIRHSWFYSDKAINHIVNLGTGDEWYEDGDIKYYYTHEGMLIENNHIINASEGAAAIAQEAWALGTTPENPAYWKNNIIETNGTTFLSGMYPSSAKRSDDWTIKFDNNSVYTTKPSKAMILTGKKLPLSNLFSYGTDNKQLKSSGDYTFTVAKRTFNIKNGVLSEIKTQTANVPEYYLPEKLKFISWDCPSIAHTGIDIDYKLTGYDWFNRDLKWSLEDAPRGMSIEKDGTLHWTPDSEGKYNVDVKLTLSDSEVITKNFTITVDNSRALFISPTGNNDTGDGSIDNPYLAFGEKVAKHIYSLGGHVTVYMRGGVHENQKFYSYSWDNPKLRRFTQYLELTKDTPFMIRNYPQEKAVIKMPVGKSGWKSSKSYRIVYGLEFSGGGSSEGGLLVLAGQSVAKRVQAHGFNSDAKGSPTGVKVTGDVILDQVVAWDNYDRKSTTSHNSSNFLFYGTQTTQTGNAYFIDCLSLSYSATGFKIAHAGDETKLHIHKSAALGGLRPWAGVQNKATVRHSWFYKDQDSSYPTFTLGITNRLTKGENNTDEGMLIEYNHVINTTEQGSALAQSSWVLDQTPDTPAFYKDNIIESNGSTFLSGMYSSNKHSDDWTIRFDSNSVYTTEDSNAMIFSGEHYPLSKLFSYGSDNKSLQSNGEYNFTVAGRTFNIIDKVLVEE